MKTFIFLLIIAFLCMATSTVNAAYQSVQTETSKNTVTLTARAVTSAIDIENAVHLATANGTRPGTIILDGRDGPFVYSGGDRSINIFYSNLTFRGLNNASFPNTGDGFFFDDATADNIRIEGLFMTSEGGSVAGVGQHKNVSIRDNTFRANGIAISIHHGKNWVVTGNTILAGGTAVQIVDGSSDITVSDNHLKAPEAVTLEGTQNSRIFNNTVDASLLGISLSGEVFSNEIYNNTILGVQQSGITLRPGVKNNRVYQNKVLCAIETVCLTIEAGPVEEEMNRIYGNLP